VHRSVKLDLRSQRKESYGPSVTSRIRWLYRHRTRYGQGATYEDDGGRLPFLAVLAEVAGRVNRWYTPAASDAGFVQCLAHLAIAISAARRPAVKVRISLATVRTGLILWSRLFRFLRPSMRFPKLIVGEGPWRVHRSDPGDLF